jgi:hypothetical protein
MSNILSTDQLENISNDITTSTNTTPPKRGRGRPAKYAKEEREEKYKEARDQWFINHRDEYNESRKEYYKNNSQKLNLQSKEYMDRARYALSILDEIWKHQEWIEIKHEHLKEKIQCLIEHKKILI